jgi:GDP-D-mannose 3', 5'-epimerase
LILGRRRILVAGASGFIGQHLLSRLKTDGHWVRGVDIRDPATGRTDADDFQLLDLRRPDPCVTACDGQIDWVFQLAADMGGIGYITSSHAAIARNNTLINAHMLEAARQQHVHVFLFSSSACVYAQSKQDSPEAAPLKEEDAYPADPEAGYGW